MSLELTKAVVSIASSLGAGVVVTNAIRCTTPGDLGKAGRIGVKIGAVVLANMVGDAASVYSMKKVDDIEGQVKAMRRGVEDAKKQLADKKAAELKAEQQKESE